MMAQELVTAVQENLTIIVVLVQNHGFHSIGDLSETLGSQRFGTRYRFRDAGSGRLDGDRLPVDLAANAASLGATVLRATTIEDFRAKLVEAQTVSGPVVVHVETDPLVNAPSSESWWDVPVSETAVLDSTQQARKTYDEHKRDQRAYLTPSSD
jgi:3D-(3,5/4)-trihydroxycyclohexane-1,2-dione acylhydrolase (decyclizing)